MLWGADTWQARLLPNTSTCKGNTTAPQCLHFLSHYFLYHVYKPNSIQHCFFFNSLEIARGASQWDNHTHLSVKNLSHHSKMSVKTQGPCSSWWGNYSIPKAKKKGHVKENFQFLHSISNTETTQSYSQVETTSQQYGLHAESINIPEKYVQYKNQTPILYALIKTYKTTY